MDTTLLEEPVERMAREAKPLSSFTLDLANARPAVIGLGYVGLPLAVAVGRHRPTSGFDISADRVAALRR